ncbi:MAG TPA: alpha/beta fold hydrolase [Stellaceae bacterium]|jgi:medium-chain acyl-[acyl-carrier-protein] hydrolase|nr:alpha/beta fold hydrolase [Stellaceae bacterium]
MAQSSLSSRWISTVPARGARARLFCFAHAGGGASFFRPWAAALPGHVELCAIQLPGRERRFAESCFDALDPLLDALMPALTPLLDRPFALFGHSLGALVAFEVARRLEAAGTLPQGLAASAFRAPHLPPERALSGLPDAEFVAEIAALGGTPVELLSDPELLETILPALRADFAIAERYRFAAGPKLTVPVAAMGGGADPWVSPAALGGWATHAGAGFRLRLFRGGHFYLVEERDAVIAELARMIP